MEVAVLVSASEGAKAAGVLRATERMVVAATNVIHGPGVLKGEVRIGSMAMAAVPEASDTGAAIRIGMSRMAAYLSQKGAGVLARGTKVTGFHRILPHPSCDRLGLDETGSTVLV